MSARPMLAHERRGTGRSSPALPVQAPSVPARRAPAAISPPAIRAGTAVQPAMMSGHDMMVAYNDSRLELSGHVQAVTMPDGSTIHVTLPKKLGALVEAGSYGAPDARLVTNDGTMIWNVAGHKPSGRYSRDSASSRLRLVGDRTIRDSFGLTSFDSSGSGTQAQHVATYQKVAELSSSFKVDWVSEHPFNLQYLPNKDTFMGDLASAFPGYKTHISGGVLTVPSTVDLSGMLGSYHQGFHSPYNQMVSGTIDTVAKAIADQTGGGKITREHVEGSIAYAEQRFRTYASNLAPLYGGLDRDGIVAVYSESLHDPSFKSFASAVGGSAKGKRNAVVRDFGMEHIHEY